jgi:response regulator RpfG family c-di-GMP phosphodiesterase
VPGEASLDCAERLDAAQTKMAWQQCEIQRLRSLNQDLALRVGDMAARLSEAVADLRLGQSRSQVSHIETVRELVTAAECRDHETGAHLVRIGYFTSLLAPVCGCDPEFTWQLLIASPMHDVGKIGIPDQILKKPGELEADERLIMEHHTDLGARILTGSSSPILKLASEIAHCHHERFDGGGYPRGLAGEEIPLSGRIVAVVDVFDAVAMDRSYRPAMSIDNALALIRDGSGSQFDPRVVDAFFSVVDKLLELRSRISRGETPHTFQNFGLFPHGNPLSFYDSPLCGSAQAVN